MGFFVRAGLCAVLALPVAAFADPPAQSQTKTYEQWVALAEAGDPSVDWTALRAAYPKSAHYDFFGKSWLDLRDSLLASGADCVEGLRLADAILKRDYTYAPAHAVRQKCYRQRGDLAKSDKAQAVFNGLADSVEASGDGETPATSYLVVTQGEERLVLILLELRDVIQTRLSVFGHCYERVDGRNLATGLKRRVYFNIDAMLDNVDKPSCGENQEQKK